MPLRTVPPETARQWVASGVWRRTALHQVVDATADDHPDLLAVADQHERLTYRELAARSSVLARWLLDQGLAPGTAVALQCANRVALAVAHFACDRADLTFVPLSNAWRRTEMVHLLRTSGAAVAVLPPAAADFDFLATVAEARGELPDLRTVGTLEGGSGDFSFEDVTKATGDERFAVERDPAAPRFVMVTSGTTDVPRMSLWTDDNLWYFMRQFGAAVELGEGDVAVGIAPANTGATGYVFPVLAPLLHGASSVLLEHWSPREAIDLLERARATIATAIPTQLIKMLQDGTVATRDYGSLRVFNNAGAPLPAESAAEVEQVFGCTVQAVYGATDGGVPVMTRVTDPPEKRYHTVGRPLPETDLRLVGERVVDGDLEDVAPGEPGEVLWRSPTKTFGYFNDPERTEAAFWGDGWYRSGDLGSLDEDGYLRIVGRVKDLIIRGGQNISPRELEDLVAGHPAVSEVSVIGIPDPVYGERACACVVVRPGRDLTFEELVAHLEGRQVARFKLPERLELFDELPKSAGAKVSKVALRVAVLDRIAAEEGPAG